MFVFGLVAGDVNLIRPERLRGGPARVRAMTRYRSPLNPASATFESATKRLTVAFDRPERAVAPGQLVALYDELNDEVLGAATILAAT